MSYDYRSDIKLVNEWAQESPNHLRTTLLFVLATIQQQLETTPAILSSFILDGVSSPYAFGSKRNGIDYINQNYRQLYKDALGVRKDPEQLLNLFSGVPGIGLVKAGFCAQLWSNKVGCLDVHNLKLYEVAIGQVRYPKNALPATRQKYINRYRDLCNGLGGSTTLWARWCHYLYQQRPGNWANGGEVSYFHYQVLTGEIDHHNDTYFLDTDYTPKFLQEGRYYE